MNLSRTKTIEQSIADTEEPEHQLRKELGPLQLTVFGVGVIIGTDRLRRVLRLRCPPQPTRDRPQLLEGRRRGGAREAN